MQSVQAPGSVVMIRPHHFRPNSATRIDNAFQHSAPDGRDEEIAAAAYLEVTRAADQLSASGVQVHLFEDEGVEAPDSVFPNNWFSTHAGGHVAVFPMYSPSRRSERRWDIIEMLKARYRVQNVIDYSGLEFDGVFLEGTGAMVLDHAERVAYAARSNRTDPVMLERFCAHFGFEPLVFDAVDPLGQPIYHTNVMMCIGTRIALICLDAISDPARRGDVRARLEATGRSVLSLSMGQVQDFAGNAIELWGRNGPLLALSDRAIASLTPVQIETLKEHVYLLPLTVPTIELAGGSVRCMLAGIHLAKRGGACFDLEAS